MNVKICLEVKLPYSVFLGGVMRKTIAIGQSRMLESIGLPL